MDGVPTIKLKDGSILPIKSDRTTHVNFIKNNNIDVNDIDSGGWISNGVYEGSYRSDTSRYIEQEKASQRIESKKKERELDNSSFNLLKNQNGKQIDTFNLKENFTMERFHYNKKYSYDISDEVFRYIFSTI